MPEWSYVTDIEPSPGRSRVLPDGRVMAESRITVTPEAIEMMWTGYMCAACLQVFKEVNLGPFPDECPVCHFPVKSQQRLRLEQDFVGEVEEMKRQGYRDREDEFMEEFLFTKSPQIHVRRDI